MEKERRQLSRKSWWVVRLYMAAFVVSVIVAGVKTWPF